MPVTKRSPPIVVYSSVDRVLRHPHAPAFTAAAVALKQLALDNTALVLCSGKTRAELEFLQQKLDITHPFVCENGGAVIIPAGYFSFDVPNTRSLAGCQVVEFGRAYADVVDVLHRTADRLGIELVGFSDMSIEEVAKACELSLLEGRLAKLREYEELFRLVDPAPPARSRLFRALGAAHLHGRTGGRFNRVGAHVDNSVGVNFLNGLYRRGCSDLLAIGVTHTIPDDNLLPLVDHAIMVADDDPGAVTVVDWAQVIVDRVTELRRKRSTASRLLPSPGSQNTVPTG